jgi:hypothetical protein
MEQLSLTKCKLKTTLRELWEDHVNWTRNAIFCLVDNLPGTDQVVKRLLKNQEDIGNLIKYYYGEEAGNKLTELLKEHIMIAGEVIGAAKTGDHHKFDITNRKWHENADEIAEFLAKANPHLDLLSMKYMMKDHLKLTTDEVVARIKKDYVMDIHATDKVHHEIRMMSDLLYMGICAQFPEKF